MKVVYFSSSSSGAADVYLKEELLKALSTSTGDTVISQWSSDDLMASVRRQLYGSSSIVSPNENLLRVIIIDVKEVDLVEKIIFELRNVDAAATDVILPRLVVLSNFLTWSGKEYDGNMLDADDSTSFLERIPTRGLISQYQLENTLFSLHKKGHDICLVPLGMFYGDTGGHFNELFKILWGDKSSLQQGTKTSFELSLMTTGRAPVMHISDVITLLCTLVTLDRTSNAVPFVIPASDGYQWSLKDFLEDDPTLFNDIAEATVGPTTLISSLPSVLLPSFPAIKSNLSVQKCTLFPLKYPNGLKDYLETIQTEFAISNSLSPFRAMIVGPPCSGKTESSNKLAELLQIPVINIVSIVEYFINGNFEDMIDLRNSLEAIDSAGGKKKGGGAFDLQTVNITESMAVGLTKELLVKLFKCKVEKDMVCVRRGYILDIWIAHFQSASGILSLFTPEKIVVETAEESEPGDAESPGSEEDDRNAIAGNLDLVIELDCVEESNIRRWMLKNGQDAETQPAKLPKDLAGGFKTFEADMGSYNAKLIPLDPPKEQCTERESKSADIVEDAEGTDIEKEIDPTKSHEDITELCKYGVNVHRICTDDLTVMDVCMSLKTACLSKQSSFGWIDKKVDAAADADVPQDEAVQEMKDVEMVEENLVGAISVQLTEEDDTFITQECAIYEKYSLDNILPDLTSLLLSIKREKPTDPLLEAINSLASKAVTMEKQEEEKSREVFYSIVEKSNKEVAEKLKELQL